MMLLLQIRDIAVALRIGLAFGKVDKTPALSGQGEAPSVQDETPSPAPKQYPLGFQPNPTSSEEES